MENSVRLPQTFRPHFAGYIAWLIVAPAVWCILLFGFMAVGAPFAVLCFLGLLGLGVLTSALIVTTSYCTITETGISVGLYRRVTRTWADVDKWSRWGDNGSLFIRFNDGRIVGTSGWAFYGDRTDLLEAVLTEKVGSATLGEAGVLPWLLDMFAGHVIRGA